MARKVLTTATGENQALSRVAEQNPMAALLWPAMYPHFDDWGRMDGRVRRIRADVFWAFDNVTAQMLEEALALFEQCGLIVRYEHEGCPYIAIPHEEWRSTQSHFKKAKWFMGGDEASDFPPPPGYFPLSPEAENICEEPARESAGKIPQGAGTRPPHVRASLSPSYTDTLTDTERESLPVEVQAAPDDPLPPPPSSPDDAELKDACPEERRLYEAFRSVRFPRSIPGEWERGEWQKDLPTLRQMAHRGIELAEVKRRTQTAIDRGWPSVTLKAVWQAWGDLGEDLPARPKDDPPHGESPRRLNATEQRIQATQDALVAIVPALADATARKYSHLATDRDPKLEGLAA